MSLLWPVVDISPCTYTDKEAFCLLISMPVWWMAGSVGTSHLARMNSTRALLKVRGEVCVVCLTCHDLEHDYETDT